MLIIFFFFFFSSRRRHTRWTGDWSSDVCSSDLYGGGAGMVLRVDVVAAALDAAYGGAPAHPVVALTPKGRLLTQGVVEELAAEPALTILSSRFEGFDERVVEHLATRSEERRVGK